jgi:ATP-binding cassette subfamily G (WHITE) protein 2
LPELFLEAVDEYESSNKVKELASLHEEHDRERALSALPGSDHKESEGHVFANSALDELIILSHRNLVNITRTPELFLVRAGLCLFMGLILGSLFYDTNGDYEGTVKRAGYFAFTAAFFFFTSLEALPIFLNEKDVFVREHGRGAYRTSSYVWANTLVYIPFFVILSLIYTTVTFFLVGLPGGASSYFFQFLTILTIFIAANGFVTMISGLVPDPLAGNGMGSALFAIQFLFSGFFIPISTMPPGWQWVSTVPRTRKPFS